MVANLLSIYIQGTEPVDRSKLQKYLLAIGNPGIVQVEVTLIPVSYTHLLCASVLLLTVQLLPDTDGCLSKAIQYPANHPDK